MTDPHSTPQGQPSSQNPYQGQPPAYQGQQPAHQGQPYGGQPAYQGQNGAPGQRNTLALVSMILGIAGFVTAITSIGAIVTGHMALSQIKKRGEEGRGMALTGLILGYVVVALTIIGIILIVAVFGAIASNPDLYDGSYNS
ncbi:DUF4190 domain-containing protein [Frigoribacterium sp. Leaf186]|jgi:peptidyl-prolyl cis-trans isomerase B (cyclophilin B)|uniref:DUF4190 domain-containing protein n=1 Tax=Frigoribacterium sp. Leaf186 TaxID=1736293 RepID=UPI0006F23C8E|nr:DUF4190 domain-containing protein [Frigoribacterium sp. Leaf186]KQS17207.1 hypothetical protein ASG05_06715 [Frigoribacterium sp. Leaf186]